jgi:DNA invertase Pin-like site-specific DNA recombinase
MVDDMTVTTRTAIAAADGGEPIAELRRIYEAKRELARAESEQVRRARAQGYSWQAIAGALEVSKQAVHKKHGKR